MIDVNKQVEREYSYKKTQKIIYVIKQNRQSELRAKKRPLGEGEY
jgi:hypothetical protein